MSSQSKPLIGEASLTLAGKLSGISVANRGNPYAAMESWPQQLEPTEAWHTSLPLISLAGTPDFDSLSEADRKRMSFYEAVNFYSLNIHGERSLMESIAHRLYRKWPAPVSDYLHHFLAEENNHMTLFGSFCLRYAGKIYPDRHMNFPRTYAPGEEDFLFFAHTLIFEEIVDYYNYVNANDATLHPVSREINRLHRFDEARHLAFGRKIAADLFQAYSPSWSPETLSALREHLANFILVTLREYVNPDIYRDLGLADPYAVAERAWQSPSGLERRQKATSKLRHFLISNGILLEEPPL